MVILHYMYILSIFFLERQISQGQKLSTLTLQTLHRMMVCLPFYVSFASLLGWKAFFWAFGFRSNAFVWLENYMYLGFFQSIQKGFHLFD